MRRTVLFLAVLAIGCTAEKAPPPDTTPAASAAPPMPAPISLADVAGTWEGTIMPSGSDTVVALQTVTAMADTAGWSLTIANAKTPTKTQVVKPTKVVAAGDSIVIEAGPFESVLRAGQKVTIHSIYRLQDGKLVGVIHATYPNNEMVMLRSTATKKM
jgi:hypothetical protein